MKKIFFLCLVSLSFFALNAQASSWETTFKKYQCLEVEKFKVDRENFSTKEFERAAAVTDEELGDIQHKIVGAIKRAEILPKITKADQEPCSLQGMILGGTVTDYKRGNRAARILIGLGAGKQKFEVQSYLKDKATGQVLTEKTVIDRKWAGIAGGDEDKGKQDFAKKIMEFIKEGK